MKNVIIAIAVFCFIGLFGSFIQVSNERDNAVATCNYLQSEQAVREQFKSLTDQWGDHEELDTLVSENEWKLIQSGNMDADQMIAMAKTVKDAYEVNGYGDYSYLTNDDKFDEAVKDYTECKKELEK